MPESDHAGDGTHGERGRVPDDVVVDLVSDERRRRVVACLADANGAVPVDDLARAVLTRERDVDPEELDRTEVRRVRDDLFQRHLPRLTPTGLVQYDSMLGTVELDTSDDRVLATVEE